MNPIRQKNHRSFAITLLGALALAIIGITVTAGQAQVAYKAKPLPSKTVVKPNGIVSQTKPLPSNIVAKPGGNVLSEFPVGAAGKLQREIVALTNQARQQAGLKPLQVKRVLTFAAQRHALNMAGKGQMSHVLDGKNVGDRLKDAGYKYSYCGENIAWRTSFPSATEVFNAWMNSPSHRANILSANFTEISIGIAKSGKTGDSYFCQVFGTPQ